MILIICNRFMTILLLISLFLSKPFLYSLFRFYSMLSPFNLNTVHIGNLITQLKIMPPQKTYKDAKNITFIATRKYVSTKKQIYIASHITTYVLYDTTRVVKCSAERSLIRPQLSNFEPFGVSMDTVQSLQIYKSDCNSKFDTDQMWYTNLSLQSDVYLIWTNIGNLNT